jgi:hypothetical protein
MSSQTGSVWDQVDTQGLCVFMVRFNQYRRVNVSVPIPAVMLLVALLPLPYRFCTLLRFVVTICAAAIAYHHWHSGSKSIALAMGFIALLFNPLVPVYLTRRL